MERSVCNQFQDVSLYMLLRCLKLIKTEAVAVMRNAVDFGATLNGVILNL
jgi:hypothetical protein